MNFTLVCRAGRYDDLHPAKHLFRGWSHPEGDHEVDYHNNIVYFTTPKPLLIIEMFMEYELLEGWTFEIQEM